MNFNLYWLMLILLPALTTISVEGSFAKYQFMYKPRQIFSPAPELILIAGGTGSGKSTFMMDLALTKGILKCVSTDFVRQVMRGFSDDPALHRSTYDGTGDPIQQWRECCNVLQPTLHSITKDSLDRGYSLVIEGVHLIPNNDLIKMWTDGGGVAQGVVLSVDDEQSHKELIFKRGKFMKEVSAKQIENFGRIRQVQNEMLRLAEENDWLLVKQTVQRDPIDIVTETIQKRHNELIQKMELSEKLKQLDLINENDIPEKPLSP